MHNEGNPVAIPLKKRIMSSQDLLTQSLAEFDLTVASTLHYLIAVSVACAGLWVIIIATLGI